MENFIIDMKNMIQQLNILYIYNMNECISTIKTSLISKQSSRSQKD